MAAQLTALVGAVGALDLVAPQRRRRRHRQHPAQHLNRHPQQGLQGFGAQPVGGRQGRGRHHRAGEKAVKHEDPGGHPQPQPVVARDPPAMAREHRCRGKTAGQGEAIAGKTVGGGKIDRHRHHRHRQQRRRRHPAGGNPQPAVGGQPAAAELRQHGEGYGHHRQPQGAEPADAGEIEHEVGKVQPFGEPVQHAEQAEQRPGQGARHLLPNRKADRAQQEKCQPIEKEDIVELGVPDSTHFLCLWRPGPHKPWRGSTCTQWSALYVRPPPAKTGHGLKKAGG